MFDVKLSMKIYSDFKLMQLVVVVVIVVIVIFIIIIINIILHSC